MSKHFALTLCLIFILKPIVAQSYVADTVVLKMPISDSSSAQFSLHIKDSRENDPRFISVYERKKFIFFPIDQIVITDNPIANGFIYNKEKLSQNEYLLGIHEFYIHQDVSMLKRVYKFNGILNLSEIKNSDTLNIGTFYYEQTLKKRKSLSDSAGFNKALNHYSAEINKDLNVVCSDTTKKLDAAVYHFRKSSLAVRKNFYTTGDVFFGTNFWGLDMEIYFSNPEPSGKFNRNSRMLRYLSYPNRESVSISSKIFLLNYRISNLLLFQNKSAFLIGFNKWHDIDEEERTLEQIFLFQITTTQRICLNKLDKKGIILGAGLMEEFSYIYSNNPSFNYGLMIHLGYKF